MKPILLLTISMCLLYSRATAQITITRGAQVYLAAGSELAVQGDLESAENIEGDGTVIFNGASSQSIRSDGREIPRLVIDNQNNVSLSSNCIVKENLQLNTGLLQLGNYSLTLGEACKTKGSNTSYIETNGDGKIIKVVGGSVSDFLFPVGSGDFYAPLLVSSAQYTNQGSIEVSAFKSGSPNKPINSSSYLDNYWVINRKHISGELSVTAFYAGVVGDREMIQPYYWDGTKWLGQQNSGNVVNKTIRLNVPEGRGEIFGMSDEKLLLRKSIVVAPNPVSDIATIYLHMPVDEQASIRIIDGKGVNAVSLQKNLKQGSNRVDINVTGLAGGYYRVVASSPHVKLSSGMIKK